MENIKVLGFALKKRKALAAKVANEVIDSIKLPFALEVVISFVSKREIRRLNKDTRGIDKVTDVLSFPATNMKAGRPLELSGEDLMFLKTDDGFVHFGDMAICLPQCKKQAKEYGVSLESEIKKLVIHSMLHLMGYDHIEDADFEVMNKKEQEFDKKIKI